MPTITQLPSGKWRAQVRRKGVYRGATFTLKRDAQAWAAEIERQTDHVGASGYAPPPKSATLADLIDAYNKAAKKESGKTKAATLKMLTDKLGATRLVNLSETWAQLRRYTDIKAADVHAALAAKEPPREGNTAPGGSGQ